MMREISDLSEKKATIQKAVIGIKARDQCIKKIEEISLRDFSSGQSINKEKIDTVR